MDLRDGGARFEGRDVRNALHAIEINIGSSLRGMDAADQSVVDAALIALDGTANKSVLGGNSVVATSMSVAHAAAQNAGIPLWQYLAGDRLAHLPLPEIQIFGGGAHAGNRVDIQDFMVIAVGAANYSEALDWTAEVYTRRRKIDVRSRTSRRRRRRGRFLAMFQTNAEALDMLVRAIERAGFRPGEQVAISLDIAASQFRRAGRYRLGLEHRELDSDALIELLLEWTRKYPIVAIEDPLAEDDAPGFVRFTAAACKVAGSRRRLSGNQRRPHSRGCRIRRVQHGAHQAQPGRNVDRSSRRARCGMRRRLEHDRFRPLRRN